MLPSNVEFNFLSIIIFPSAPLSVLFLPPVLPHRLLHTLHPYSAQVDRCLAGWPVIITVVPGVPGGWSWLFFEYFTAGPGQARTGQDRTGHFLWLWVKEGEMRIRVRRTGGAGSGKQEL